MKIIKLIKGKEKFYVVCHTSNGEYEDYDTYTFPSIEEVEKFLGMRNDYENHIYYDGEDICGINRSIGSHEFVDTIYSKIDYEIDWRDESNG